MGFWDLKILTLVLLPFEVVPCFDSLLKSNKMFCILFSILIVSTLVSGQEEGASLVSSEDQLHKQDGSCSRLKLENLDPSKFIYTCTFPSRPLEGQVENCGDRNWVEKNTQAFFRCRPPFKSRRRGFGDLNSWICQQGTWSRVHGQGSSKLVCYQVPPGQRTTVAPSQEPVILTPVQRPLAKEPIPVTRVERPLVKEEIKCPPLGKISVGVGLECVTKSEGVTVTNSCNVSMSVGSEAKYFCEEYYEPTFGLSNFFRKCRDDGTWTGSREQFYCVVQCGTSNAIRTPLITRGTPALRGQWPWASALYLKIESTSNFEFICGGSLISPTVVVTAGHCVTLPSTNVARKASDFQIYFGKDFLNVVDEFVQKRNIKKVILHPSYSFVGYDSDLALLILDKPIKLTFFVQPICWPQTIDSTEEEFQLAENSLGTVAGFGRDETGNVATKLQVTNLPIVGRSKCQENVQDLLGTSIQMRSTTYCAGFGNGTNVCYGDRVINNGSPFSLLITLGSGMYFPSRVQGRANKWYIQGVVSVGIPGADNNCDPTKYSFFTRLGRYADWLVKTLSIEEN